MDGGVITFILAILIVAVFMRLHRALRYIAYPIIFGHGRDGYIITLCNAFFCAN